MLSAQNISCVLTSREVFSGLEYYNLVFPLIIPFLGETAPLFSFLFNSSVCLDTKVVGPLVAAPAKPLPEELEEFYQRSGIKGVILVSFGTVLANRDDNILSLLADAFSKLPHYFIWKLRRGSVGMHLLCFV